MTSVDITEWDNEKVAGYITATRNYGTAIQLSLVLHDDGARQLFVDVADDEHADLVARRCEACSAITVAKVIPLDGLLAPKALAEENDDNPEQTNRNGDTPDEPDTGNRWN